MSDSDGKNKANPSEEGKDRESNLTESESLVREYLSRKAAGEDVNPEEYYKKYPKLEGDMKKLFARLKAQEDGGEEIASALDQGKAPKTIGDFVIIREVGRGGMGTVYEAEQISLNRRVALKLLPAHLSFSDDAIVKFKREAEAGGRQSHHGIVAVYAMGEHGGTHYIAQELVEDGVNLSDRIKELQEEDELPTGYFRDAAKLVAEVAEALQHAHEVGVIHRDIKPSNILITKEGNPKVTDFGLAKIEDALSLSRSGELMGTPYYMSPEQAASRRIGIDHRTDIFSLGVTLYELLTMERPFKGNSAQEVLKNILLLEPVDPHRINSRVQRDLGIITLKALEKMPDRRYQTMQEFADDLRRFLQGEMILAKPAGPMTQVWKRVKRNPMVSMALGISLLALLLFIFVVPWIIAQRERENLEQILRLSDVMRLSQLTERSEALWPAYPEMIADMEEWVERAEELLGRVDDHRTRLEQLRSNALPYTPEMADQDKTTHPDYGELLALRENKSAGEHILAQMESALEEPDLDQEKKADFKRGIIKTKQDLEEINSRIDELEEKVAVRRTWKFEDTESQWQHDLLEEMVLGLQKISREGGVFEDVKNRIAFASTIEEKTIAQFQKEWDKAIDFIADPDICPVYEGLVLKKQIGLVPIGQDPVSGLWEFAHFQTGEIPKRDQDGALVYGEEHGIVFVLIPGGTFNMGCVKPDENHPLGSPNVYPTAESDEGPVHEVTIRPFFVSKFEITQGQWLRFTKDNPSYFNPQTGYSEQGKALLYPVDQVNWDKCVQVLSRLNLRLPSEAEWEYVARAGAGTPWWTGQDPLSLQDAANIADEEFHQIESFKGSAYESGLNDGFFGTSPVNAFKPNPLGLYGICGNVWEWCQDVYMPSFEGAPNDGSAREAVTVNYRIQRGGSWSSPATKCRSSYRDRQPPDLAVYYSGVRPALSLQE